MCTTKIHKVKQQYFVFAEKTMTKHITIFSSMPSDANAMTTKGNVVLYLDKELVEKSKELGFNSIKMFENHLKYLITGYSVVSTQNSANLTENKGNLVGLPELTALELNKYCSPHVFLRAVRGVMFLLGLG
jgi:hypothetical protein